MDSESKAITRTTHGAYKTTSTSTTGQIKREDQMLSGQEHAGTPGNAALLQGMIPDQLMAAMQHSASSNLLNGAGLSNGEKRESASGKISQQLPGIKHLAESSAVIPYTSHTSGMSTAMTTSPQNVMSSLAASQQPRPLTLQQAAQLPFIIAPNTLPQLPPGTQLQTQQILIPTSTGMTTQQILIPVSLATATAGCSAQNVQLVTSNGQIFAASLAGLQGLTQPLNIPLHNSGVTTGQQAGAISSAQVATVPQFITNAAGQLVAFGAQE
ncbi:PREDICTED: uncharacterized protein LOC106806498 [Priapulus caudatus]|uniref:Uncharacterized protein LOC106806498 n=1 Tax=Priapulus caudatus TaxID=37621 RepID=A0ABM1DVI0_PRICU|nr:PREDICTED: uncharacterized protein LOC106806498 [Priapulus caudatus]